ncbi:MAG: cytochrome c maturation protein CcmE [Alphaproteobacteria bacterium]
MTRKRRRLYAVLAGLMMLGIAAALVLTALRDSVVFFYSPSDLAGKQLAAGQRIRIGGLVAAGSVAKSPDGVATRFTVTDMKAEIPVSYSGILPDLFREGQGVVVEGRLEPGGAFQASEVLAKHDENYMPPEVADALKRAGRWKHADEQPAK